MAAFLFCGVSPNDMEQYQAGGYLDVAPWIAAKHKSVYRTRGGIMDVLEGNWQPKRMVIVEFPTMADLKGFVDDPEYQPLYSANIPRQHIYSDFSLATD